MRTEPHRLRGLAATGTVTTLVAAALTAGSLLAPSTASGAIPDPASLAVHYDFAGDPLADGIVVDRSGHGADGTLVHKETATLVPGTDGTTALDLPGGAPDSGGAYVEVPKAVLSGATDLTVSARVRWDGTGGSWQRIFDLGESTTRYLFLTPSAGDGTFRAAITTSGGSGESVAQGYAALPAGAWKTVTVTLDTVHHAVALYLDGALVDTRPTTLTAGQLLGSTATRAGYLGRSQYPDPLFQGALDDFQVYRSALTPAQVAELVDGAVPSLTALTQTSFEVRTDVGVAPALPASIRATYSDGVDRNAPATWDPVDPASYAAPGEFTVHGTAGGQTVTAHVTVTRPNQLTVDLGKDTGAFHGGASGTLYGVYGDGVPSRNLIEGMHLRTVATKAQDGPQHPGADALDVVEPLADSTGGDVYIYMTDIYRGFPYQWPGSTPEARLDDFKAKIAKQVDQVLSLPQKYQDHVVFVPFNEPEGNMFGTGQWSYNRISWLNDPQYYFKAWDDVYALIRSKMPNARIAGPNTSVLYSQVKGFLAHAVAHDTVPDVMTWHELSNPASIRTNVAKYRDWEAQVFQGTAYDGLRLPINLDEYAFNYHTSVPGQMIQWASAIEDAKVDADIAYWNIDGNLSDSAVQANRGNGQWWLLNAYGQMTGHTVQVTPPRPNTSYTLQGVATLDRAKAQARVLLGGASGEGSVRFANVDPALFGTSVHALVQEIPWTGQIGDSPQPETVAELDLPVVDHAVSVDFGGVLPKLKESSAYQVILAPGTDTTSPSQPTTLWQHSYEAEDATYTGSGYSRNGPEGSPSHVDRFYTSGGYDVGGLRTGSNGVLSFPVTVPQDGTYDLSVFANSLNTYPGVADQGPTNVYLSVDGGQEQELFLPLGYKWVVWDHSDAKVHLTAGNHTIALAAQSLDGSGHTQGDAIVDKLDLSLANPAARDAVYEAENAELRGAQPVYDVAGTSGAGAVPLRSGESATFWVYAAHDGEAALSLAASGKGNVRLTLDDQQIAVVGGPVQAGKVFLRGGVNKLTVTGVSGSLLVDRVSVAPSAGTLPTRSYEAEDADLAGTTSRASLLLASGGKAVTGIGGDPGNGNTLTFHVQASDSGPAMVTVRYSNPEQSPATHYNPDPLARHADVSVNGGPAQRVLFPHSFHQDNFWELSFPVTLVEGANTIRFSSEELPNFDGTTYASALYPEPLRSRFAPDIDRISVTALMSRRTF
jgi:hypothetical protein